MKWMSALLLILAGCSSSSVDGQRDRVTILILNDTELPVTGTVSAGLLSTRVTVAPHTTESFWVFRALLPNAVRFTIVPTIPDPVR